MRSSASEWVTSGNNISNTNTGDAEGTAMKSEPILIGGRRIHSPGTIIGKALEPLATGVREILVLLSLQ